MFTTSGNYAWSQVTKDNTLGNENSLVTSPRLGAFQIDGGATRGTNLFHSFSQFSVPTGGNAYFNNALNVQNIISRVTGNSASNIDGLIRSNGTANLFLINPNGIIFGPNAKLNIGGSFMASTASSLLFADGTQFSATDTQIQPLLTISVPVGLQLGNNPAGVRVNRSNLEVKPKQNLVLVGGDVSLDKGKLTALGGRIELGGLSTDGDVGLNQNGSLNFPSNVARADVSVTNGAAVNVRAGGGGFISINAGNLEVARGSKLTAGIGKDLGTPEAQAGNVVINASDTVSFDGSRVENQVDQNGKGNAGHIEITAGSLFLSNQAELNTNTRGMGNAGQVIIHASDTVSLDRSYVSSRVEKKAVGNSGGIDITTGSLSLVNKAGLTAKTESTGNAGQIIIRASGSISMNSGFVSSQVGENGKGNAGGIVISADSLSLSNKASIDANTNTGGMGNAGQVSIHASDTISSDGSFVSSRVEQNAVGSSGGIVISADSLSLSNNTSLDASTGGVGNAGQVILHGSDSISLNRSFVSSSVKENAMGNSGGIVISTDSLSLSNKAELSANTEGAGNAGGIDITVDSLSLSNKALLSANTEGVGNAGQVIIRASDSISLDRSFVNSRVNKNAVGNSGGIDIRTRILSLANNAGLTATTEGTGNAGQVIIHASDSISLRDKTYVNSRVAENGKGNAGGIDITTETLALDDASLNVGSFGQGNAGNINVVADSIRLDNGASINANTQGGQGNINLTSGDLVLRHGSRITTDAKGSNVIGGNITINTGVLAALENSDISANSTDFRGGNVNITAQGIFGTKFRSQPTEESDITATGADSSLNGTVTINAPDVDPSRGLAELPVIPANVEVAQDCQGSGQQASVAFFHTGRGGLAPNPYEPINSSGIWEDVPSPTQKAENSAGAATASTSPVTPSNKIVEAQGWLINQKGEVTLVAQMPTTASKRRCRLR
ncbi:MAG TPA: S-layer family protein [Waterburya sp.]